MLNNDLDDSLIQALLNPACYPHPVDKVKLLETHISWLLLAGDYVYKIKKPVDFGFLDFSSLDRRQFFCHEELRLNRRLAAGLYLEVAAIGGSARQPVFGLEPAIEYAVKMRRFAEADLLDHCLANRQLTKQHLRSLAATLAQFHAAIPKAAQDSGYGNAEAIALPARQNFQQLSLLLNESLHARLTSLQAASEAEYNRCLPLLRQRLESGWVRECHGDLHLGNIVLIDGLPTPFDGIEFNPALRWIDVMNDIAFLVMDLRQRQRPDLAFTFLNAYLEIGGDYAGLGVLRFYLGYRAMVMAKVSAIRSAQLGEKADAGQCQRYLALAEQFYAPARPVLMITHGLPGCGKTTISQLVLEKYHAIRLRSDVERKRLFGLQAEQSSMSIKADIYTPAATERTYRHLLDVSRRVLTSGFSVIVDAAFLKQQERAQFKQLADELGLPFVILQVYVDENLQKQRLGQRRNDASEADETVMESLKTACQPLLAAERVRAVKLLNTGTITAIDAQQSVWRRLDQLSLHAKED